MAYSCAAGACCCYCFGQVHKAQRFCISRQHCMFIASINWWLHNFRILFFSVCVQTNTRRFRFVWFIYLYARRTCCVSFAVTLNWDRICSHELQYDLASQSFLSWVNLQRLQRLISSVSVAAWHKCVSASASNVFAYLLKEHETKSHNLYILSVSNSEKKAENISFDHKFASKKKLKKGAMKSLNWPAATKFDLSLRIQSEIAVVHVTFDTL